MSNDAKVVKCIDGLIRPATFSDKSLIAADERNIVAFWDWFSDSVMVNADSKPIAFYHGAASIDGRKPFDTFSSAKSNWNGLIFFSDEYSVAQDFVSEKSAIYDTDSYIFTVALNIKSLFDSRNPDHVDRVLAKLEGDSIDMHDRYMGGITHKTTKEYLRTTILHSNSNWVALETKELMDAIRKAGFDGIKIFEYRHPTFAVFSDDQVYIKNQSLIIKRDATPIKEEAAPGHFA